MADTITHNGIIDSIEADGHVRVRITQSSACAGCKVASHCSASESKVKVVDVYHCLQKGLCVGDSVTVSTSQTVAGRALLLAFGLPLVLLLIVLAAMLMAGNDEGMSAVAALMVLLPYYIILWLCRERIAGNISFFLSPQVGEACGS